MEEKNNETKSKYSIRRDPSLIKVLKSPKDSQTDNLIKRHDLIHAHPNFLFLLIFLMSVSKIVALSVE